MVGFLCPSGFFNYLFFLFFFLEVLSGIWIKTRSFLGGGGGRGLSICDTSIFSALHNHKVTNQSVLLVLQPNNIILTVCCIISSNKTVVHNCYYIWHFGWTHQLKNINIWYKYIKLSVYFTILPLPPPPPPPPPPQTYLILKTCTYPHTYSIIIVITRL